MRNNSFGRWKTRLDHSKSFVIACSPLQLFTFMLIGGIRFAQFVKYNFFKFQLRPFNFKKIIVTEIEIIDKILLRYLEEWYKLIWAAKLALYQGKRFKILFDGTMNSWSSKIN